MIGAGVAGVGLLGYALFGGSSYPPKGLAPSVKGLPDWITRGCGDAEYYCPEKGATFPGDKCPEIMPDLSKSNNFMADVLKKNPEVYYKLKDRKTSLGVTFAKC